MTSSTSSSYGFNAYRSNELNIAMRTSSGDVIQLDFANKQSTSLNYSKNDNSSKLSRSFSTMESFKFSIKSNGISEQDQKEIDSFMKIAQPFIDTYLQDLQQTKTTSPLNKLSREIANIFEPNRARSVDEKNTIKTNIVKVFDKARTKLQNSQELTTEEKMQKIINDAQKLLEKTLQEFDNFRKNFYA